MKVLNIVGLVLSLCAIVLSQPLCKFTTIDSKYTCLMEKSEAADAATQIGGTHGDTTKNDASVLRVTTTDKANVILIKSVLTKFANLEELQIQNGIASLTGTTSPFLQSICKKLKKFQLSKSSETKIPDGWFSGCKELEEVDFTGNNLASFMKDVFGEPGKIIKLILSNNTISLDPAISTLFDTSKELTNLKSLNLSGIGATEIHAGFNFPSAILTELDLSNNKLTTLPSTFIDAATTLETLNLHINKFAIVGEDLFKKLTSLKKLRIGSNEIADINAKAFNANTNLELLDVSKNPLKTLNSALLKDRTKLKSLDLQEIQITSSSIAPLKEVLTALTNLETLNISSNNIGSIDGIFNSSTNLINLSINSMQLGTLPSEIFNTLTKLENLSFNGNNITEIPENIFAKTIKMKSISAQNNKIVRLKTSTFEKMTELQVLDFTGNEINAIERTFFDNLKKLTVVKFGGTTNKCIKDDFLIFNLTEVKDKLEPCFVNYSGAQAIIISNLLLALVIALKFI